MASVSVYDEKKFRIVFYDKDKTPKRKTVYWKRKSYYKDIGFTERQAKQKAWEMEQRHKTKEIDLWEASKEKSSLLLSEVIKLWLEKAKKTLAHSTVTDRTIALNLMLKEMGDSYIHSITDEQWNDYINSAKALQTRNGRRTLVKGLYTALQEKGYPYQCNVKVYSTKEERNESTQVTEDQWLTEEEFLSVCESHIKLSEKNSFNHTRQNNINLVHFFKIAFYTGLRRSDILALQKDWISEDFKVMKIGGTYTPKSQLKQETIALLPKAQEVLKECYHLLPFTCLPNHVTTRFKKALLDAVPEKPGIHLHSLRHSFVMYCLDDLRLPERIVKQLTRHKDDRSFKKYIHDDVNSVLNYFDEAL